MPTIPVIVGSTREGRFSEKPAQWIFQHLQKRAGIEARLLELRDFPMPFLDQALTPAKPRDAATHFIGQSSIFTVTDKRATGEAYCLVHHVTVEGNERRLMLA